jgi:hypothetical protein
LAAKCDELFPARRGWFSDWYDESRTWAEVEERAAPLRDWYPGIVTGLIQSESYARALVAAQPETVNDLSVRFDRLRAESYRESESLTMIERLGEVWAADVNPLTAMATGASA